MTSEMLSEILETLHDAGFGYCSVNTQMYYKHVCALVADRNQLIKDLEDLRNRTRELQAKSNEDKALIFELEKEIYQYKEEKILAEGEIRRLQSILDKITDSPSSHTSPGIPNSPTT